jgi:hypothetical protein
MDEPMSVQDVLDGVITKANVVRRVRTREGVQKYGQSLGSVIRPDVDVLVNLPGPMPPTATVTSTPIATIDRTSPGKPVGVAGSDLLDPDGAPKKVRARVDIALAAINKVHGLGDMTIRGRLPMDTLKARAGKDGGLVIEGSFPRKIVIRPGAPYAAMTTAHEYGHLLDYMALGGTKYSWTSEQSSVPDPGLLIRTEGWKKFHDAVYESEGYKRIFRKVQVEYRDREGNIQTTTGGLGAGSKQYFSLKIEQFARAYSQWIAIRSQDEQMMKELREIQAEDAKAVPGKDDPEVKNRVVFHGQWDDDDFEPIAAALDEIFREEGWTE